MSAYFCVSVTFLDPAFHGRGDGGEPEWPPSPLRLFQAMVAAAAGRYGGGPNVDLAREALGWLEKQPGPVIIAPIGRPAVPIRIAVPNNDLDLVAAALSQGREPKKQPVELKTMKTVHPTRIMAEADKATVRYIWSIRPDDPEFGRVSLILPAIARNIIAVGWGIDLVAADGKQLDSQYDFDKLSHEKNTEVWRHTDEPSGIGLRVPKANTLAALESRYGAFLSRLANGGYSAIPPLEVGQAFHVVGYRRATDPAARSRWAAYRIVSADPDVANPSFDTARRARDVACWVRHAAGRVWADRPDVATFVHGHCSADDANPVKGAAADDRLMFLPLPTINHGFGHRVESIRRVLVAGPTNDPDHRFDQIRRLLEGQELMWEGDSMGLLVPLSESDWVLRQYVGEGRVWSTVTPVIWPGYDDRDPDKAGKVLRRAFVHAGLPPEVVDAIPTDTLEWRSVGFRPGVELASRYEKPDKLPGRAFHVRVTFPHPVRGPLAVGAGRYRGVGVFAVEATPPLGVGR